MFHVPAGLLAAASLVLALAGPAVADPARAVVELFTSQACSASPAADRLIGRLAREPDLVVVSFPVDYWDYLGWKDTLAHTAFTARQRAYAHRRGDRTLFTPQIIVNGRTVLVGADRGEFDRAAATSILSVPVEVREEGGAIALEVGAATGGARAGQLWLVPVSRERQVAVQGGENRGRTMTYTNVARGLVRVGTWSGERARFEVPRATAYPDGADGYVALLQADGDGPGRMLGAARSPAL